MRRVSFDLAILIVCAVLLALVGYQQRALEQQRRPSVYSTYDTGPNGYRALYEVLTASGVRAGRFERPLPALDPFVRTLVITGYENDPSAKPLAERDVEALRRFAENGGRIVAIDSEFAGAQDVTPGIGTTQQTHNGGDGLALALNAFTLGVARASGSIDWTFPYDESHGVPLLANRRGIVAVWYRIGRGEVVAVTAPALFGNQELRNADNLRFVYNTLAGHGPVAFDEYVHGYDESLGAWDVLPPAVRVAVLLAILLGAIALIGANVPFAPPLPRDSTGERDSTDYITAIAQLLRRSRNRPPDEDVVWQAALDFQRRKEHA
jgi:hypothetical protein